MRRVALAQIALGVAAGVMLAAPLASRADPPAPAPPTTAPPPTAPPAAAPRPAASHATAPAPAAQPDPSAAFYPAAARAAGVEGSATIRCSRSEHLALVNCSLVSETPTGQGFGAAALAMAAQSPANPKVDIPEMKTRASADTVLHFSLHPPSVTPDVTLMAHVMSGPTILTKPTDAQIKEVYPVRALSDQVEGGAIIVCTVSEQGVLASCRVAREVPDSYGFGQAAIDLAPHFKMAPAQVDGEPIGGAPVTLTVPFRSADPTAPLTLDTKPAGSSPP
jgi:TonB family protein